MGVGNPAESNSKETNFLIHDRNKVGCLHLVQLYMQMTPL